MDRIEVKILNPSIIAEAEQMMVFAARLTQKGHAIQNMADLMCLYMKEYTENTVTNLTALPHPTIQKFATINVAVVGVSRRFLAQITRHQKSSLCQVVCNIAITPAKQVSLCLMR